MTALIPFGLKWIETSVYDVMSTTILYGTMLICMSTSLDWRRIIRTPGHNKTNPAPTRLCASAVCRQNSQRTAFERRDTILGSSLVNMFMCFCIFLVRMLRAKSLIYPTRSYNHPETWASATCYCQFRIISSVVRTSLALRFSSTSCREMWSRLTKSWKIKIWFQIGAKSERFTK